MNRLTKEFENLSNSVLPEDKEIMRVICNDVIRYHKYLDEDHETQLKACNTIGRIFEQTIIKYLADLDFTIIKGLFDVHFFYQKGEIIVEITTKKVSFTNNDNENIQAVVDAILSAIKNKLKDLKRKQKIIKCRHPVFIVVVHIITNHVFNIVSGYPEKIYALIAKEIELINDSHLLSGVVLSLASPYTWFPSETNKYWGTPLKPLSNNLKLIKNDNARNKIPENIFDGIFEKTTDNIYLK